MATFAIRATAGWLGTDALPAADVLVEIDGGVVSFAGPARGRPAAGDVPKVEGFLVPAVADRHVHIGLADPAAVLRGGVTAVRDLAWPSDRIFPLADVSEVPTFEGPLVRAAGPMLTAPGGYPARASWAPPGTARELDGADDAADAVRELHALGAAAIKVSLNAEAGPTPSDPELAAIVEAAHAVDLPVTVHAQGRGEVDRALGAGVDELAHTPWTERLSDDTIRRAARALRIVSTLDILGRGRETTELGVALDNLGRFRAAGGTVVYGTDLGNGDVPPGVHVRELELLRAAGLSVDEVLRAAIRAPLGSGAPADLLVLGDSPFGNLTALRTPSIVVRAGRRVA